jgi:hypothetical protein
VVPVAGLEPACIAAPDFESGVSTISPHWHVFEEDGIIGIVCLKTRKSGFTNPFSIFADIRVWNFYCFIVFKLTQKDLT